MTEPATKEAKLRALLETIALSIARYTTTPEIAHYNNEAKFTLRVDPRDQGRLVGKKGSVIWAIQTIFWFAGLTQLGWSYTIELLEPESPKPNQPSPPFKFNPKWDRKKIEKLLNIILETCLPLHETHSLQETDETSATIHLNLPKYLSMQLSNPSFPEAFESVMKAAGMSNGAAITTEHQFT